MDFEIDYNSTEERFYLIENVGEEPCTYECIAQYCWRDCVPCCFCEASKKVIKDKEVWEIWKGKYINRKKIPCSSKHNNYFQNYRLKTINFNENYFAIVDGNAVPIQTTLNFD